MSEAPKFGLVHTEWYTDDDCDRVEGSREAMQASADRLNAEWPAERWHVAPAVDSAPVAAPDLQAAYVAEVSRHRETMHERDHLRLSLTDAINALWDAANGAPLSAARLAWQIASARLSRKTSL